MGEIYLSFAAFLFYIKTTGLKYETHKEHLSLHYSTGGYYFCPIMPEKGNYDCGYIVLNIDDFQTLFGKTAEIVDLTKGEVIDLFKCERPKHRRIDGSIEHCKLPEELWGNIPTEIAPGNIINCKRTK